jgi:hypothetical protein
VASADKDKLGADLSAYLDGELSPARAREIERLLTESAEARQTLAELRAVSQGLAGLPHARAPEDLPDMVRRNAERRALLQDRSPARRTRVLRLVTRISASAALIAACMFAGWSVLQWESQPAALEGEHLAAAPQEVAPGDKDAEVSARGIVTAESGRGEIAGEADREDSDEAPRMAASRQLQSLGYLAQPPEVRAEETVAADIEHHAADETDAGGFFVRTAGNAAPVVSVTVRPRSPEEYNATLVALARWQEPSTAPTGGRAGRGVRGEPLGEDAAELFVGDERRWHAGSGEWQQQDFAIAVPPERVHQVLVSLEERAPEQVQVAMHFSPSDIPKVQRMVMPTSPAPTEAWRLAAKGVPAGSVAPQAGAREQIAEGEDVRAGGALVEESSSRSGTAYEAGRVARRAPERPAQPEGAMYGKRGRGPTLEEHGQPENAGTRGETGRTLADQATEAGEEKTDAAVADQEEPQRRAGTRVDLGRPSPSKGPAATPTKKTVALDSIDADGAASEKTEIPRVLKDSLRDCAVQIGSRLRQLYDAMLGLVSTPAAPAEQPTRASVTLRVTLLPPPTAATQPAAAPADSAPPENP